MLVHLGTESGSKAYRLFEPTNKKVVVSRDAIFDENEDGIGRLAIKKRRREHSVLVSVSLGIMVLIISTPIQLIMKKKT